MEWKSMTREQKKEWLHDQIGQLERTQDELSKLEKVFTQWSSNLELAQKATK